MLKYCEVIYKTYYNEKLVATEVFNSIKNDTDLGSETIPITWDNIEEFLLMYDLIAPFYVSKNKRNGKRFVGWSSCRCDNREACKKIKEEKGPLNINFVIEIVETKASIEKILKYHDSELAIKYLVERGLSITGSGN